MVELLMRRCPCIFGMWFKTDPVHVLIEDVLLFLLQEYPGNLLFTHS